MLFQWKLSYATVGFVVTLNSTYVDVNLSMICRENAAHNFVILVDFSNRNHFIIMNRCPFKIKDSRNNFQLRTSIPQRAQHARWRSQDAEEIQERDKPTRANNKPPQTISKIHLLKKISILTPRFPWDVYSVSVLTKKLLSKEGRKKRSRGITIMSNQLLYDRCIPVRKITVSILLFYHCALRTPGERLSYILFLRKKQIAG